MLNHGVKSHVRPNAVLPEIRQNIKLDIVAGLSCRVIQFNNNIRTAVTVKINLNGIRCSGKTVRDRIARVDEAAAIKPARPEFYCESAPHFNIIAAILRLTPRG